MTHVADGHYRTAIDRALALKGFVAHHGKSVMVGFFPQCIWARGQGDRGGQGGDTHFFLVRDASARSRKEYYTRVVEKVPDDCDVLTLPAEVRFFEKQLGDSAASRFSTSGSDTSPIRHPDSRALSKAFNVGVNELPVDRRSPGMNEVRAILLTFCISGSRPMGWDPLPASSRRTCSRSSWILQLKPISTRTGSEGDIGIRERFG